MTTEKKMLIEALKPGMRAKVRPNSAAYVIVERVDDEIVYVNSSSSLACVSVNTLTATDYEIIPDEPKPWVPSDGDFGYNVDFEFDVFELGGPSVSAAIKTRKAAEHKAKLDRIHTAIMNMPGACEGNLACVFWGDPNFKAVTSPGLWAMEYPFDDIENAQAAADYANKLIKAIKDE